MEDNKKKAGLASGYSEGGTVSKRAVRARNRTVLLSSEATQDMRSQLNGAAGIKYFENLSGGKRIEYDQDLANRRTEKLDQDDVEDLINRLDFNDSNSGSEAETPSFSEFPFENVEKDNAVISDLEELNRRLASLSNVDDESSEEAVEEDSEQLAGQATSVESEFDSSIDKLFSNVEEVVQQPVNNFSNESLSEELEEEFEAEEEFEDESEFDVKSVESLFDELPPENIPPVTIEQIGNNIPEENISTEKKSSVEAQEIVEEVVNKIEEEVVPVVAVKSIENKENKKMSVSSNAAAVQEGIFWSKETPLIGFLVALNDNARTKYYELHAGRLVVSSEPVVGGSYLLLKEDSVSPMHAVLKIAMNGTLQILDQLSENGTKIERFDSGEIVELSGDKANVGHGDVLSFGDCRYAVCLISLRE